MNTLTLLQKLVAIPSPFPQEQAVVKYIYNYLDNIGFTINRVPTGKKRTNLVATFGKSSSYLGFYGHVDTIPPDRNYPRDPFVVKISKGKAYGLGVADMKGGITAMLKVGEFAVENKLPIRLIFGVDEENISEGAHDLVDSKRLQDIGFLIVGESGQAADMKQPYNVCYGRKGRILFEVKIAGKKAHAAEADKGINAIEHGASLVKILQSIQFLEHDRLGKTQIIIHSFQSQTDSFSVPDTCTILFSLLTTPNITSEEVIKKINQKVSPHGITFTIHPFPRKTPYGESYEVNRQAPFIRQLEKEVFKHDSIQPVYATSVADENVFANRLRIPVITLGPIGGGDHTIHEWLDIASLESVITTYQTILRLYNR